VSLGTFPRAPVPMILNTTELNPFNLCESFAKRPAVVRVCDFVSVRARVWCADLPLARVQPTPENCMRRFSAIAKNRH